MHTYKYIALYSVSSYVSYFLIFIIIFLLSCVLCVSIYFFHLFSRQIFFLHICVRLPYVMRNDMRRFCVWFFFSQPFFFLYFQISIELKRNLTFYRILLFSLIYFILFYLPCGMFVLWIKETKKNINQFILRCVCVFLLLVFFTCKNYNKKNTQLKTNFRPSIFIYIHTHIYTLYLFKLNCIWNMKWKMEMK